ncbi:efflux RND transporter periplasmic adaptor subunit [Castellaniella caeni]|uniref:efflux RND transporter periplasmic adaptor subunit n=1 Tax=Castellaniella caeni TaxID=266123 RepID=UPI0021558AC7|nr:efflux RND transporter periplasmic adaptor subunit [Castellaniella caeni]
MMSHATTQPAGRRRRVWIWIAVCALLALAVWRFWPQSAAPSGGRGFRGGAGQTTPVSVTQARAGQIDRTLRALGTVTSLATVTIRSRVDGPLQALHFEDGQSVQAGALLAEIDPRPFRIQLQQAQGQQMQHAAQLENAQRDLARYEQLARQDSVARQQLDAARAQVRELQGQAKVDQAAVDDARLQLSYTRITAPVAGQLGLHKVDVGNMVHASDADGLVVLTQSQPIDVVFTVPQTRLLDVQQARRLTPGLQTQLFSQVGGKALATGTLLAVDNQIDVATGTVQLKSRFDNPDALLFPNQFVQVSLRLGLESGLVLPLRAVQRGSVGEYVYRVDAQHKAHVVPVTTGVDDGQQVVIESGLQENDTVVVEGTDRLRDGSPVEVVTPEASDGTAGASGSARAARGAAS